MFGEPAPLFLPSCTDKRPFVRQNHFFAMDEQTYNALEIESLIGLLAGYVQCPLGRARVQRISFSTDLAEIDRNLDLTTECRDHLTNFGGFGLSGITDPEGSLSQLAIVDSRLDPHQVIVIERLLSVGVDLRALVSQPELRTRFPRLAAVTGNIPDLRRVLASFRGKILPNGEIDDNASPTLRRIRREINERRAHIYRSLESLMRDHSTSIQEEIVTIRSGRFVVPVRTDSRGQVQGVVHGLSSSGQTTYVEPLNVINQNNDLVRLHEEEEIEIARILMEISETLRANLPGIRATIDAVAEVDFTQAKARLASDFNCVRPLLSRQNSVVIENARHLLLANMLRRSGGTIVPVSLEMDADHQVLVISGPNAGGKTVVLKTVGLLVAMAQMGLHVPAEEAVLPLFEQVFADIGDQQSIAANLSTFTAHMRNISGMAERLGSRPLVLLDEVGTGTDPQEGAALAVAIVDYFKRSGATTIVTTHYNELKMWVSQTPGVLNASVEFDWRTLQPTYRLISGVAGASAGLEIARRMSLPDEIISEAGGLLDPSHARAAGYLKQLKALVDEQEQLRAALEEEREATAQKFARLDLEFARREADRQAAFEQEVDRVVRELTNESQSLIKSLKEKSSTTRVKKDAEAAAAKLKRSAAVVLKKQTASAAPVSKPIAPDAMVTVEPALEIADATARIAPRDRVLVISLNKEGIAESIAGENATVLVGSVKLRVKRDDLRLVISRESDRKPERVSSEASRIAARLDETFETELKVIGLNADDATDQVDKFLDEASMAGAETVRIIHGHGTGTLRRAIAQLLTSHPHVESFTAAPPNQGGTGATLVQLRK